MKQMMLILKIAMMKVCFERLTIKVSNSELFLNLNCFVGNR